MGIKRRFENLEEDYQDIVSWPMINGELFVVNGLSPEKQLDEATVSREYLHGEGRAIQFVRDTFIYYGDE